MGAAALDTRRFVELARDGLERLPQQENPERARDIGEAHRDDGVLEAERRIVR